MSQTETSMAWLDRIVRARYGAQNANHHIATLTKLMRRGDADMSVYDPVAEAALAGDGTAWKIRALRNRVATIEADLCEAERHGSTVSPVLLALAEANDTLTELILATGLLLEKAGNEVPEDPFIDRLEEHPAHERT